MKLSELVQCTDGEATLWGFINTSFAPDLLYYSYYSIILISLLIGTFVLFKNKFTLVSKIFFFLNATFAILIFNEIIQWIVIPAGIVYFSFSISILFHFLILTSLIYFAYLFVYERDMLFRTKLFGVLLGLPIIMFLPSSLNLSGVELDTCTGQTGILWSYFYAIHFLTVILFLFWSIKIYSKYRIEKAKHLMASSYLLLGSFLFTLIYFVSFYYAEETGVYEINLVGPLGMLIFIVILSYLIVRFNALQIKIAAAQVLVMSLIILVGSQFFFIESMKSHILVLVTLIIASIGGYFLVKSVKREINLRERIEGLVLELDNANIRLKELDKMKSEFVSIASHQLRSPLTSIRGYASMLVDGSYGKLPQKAFEVLEKIVDSSKFMALSIEDYLNVSRIEAGNMKYESADFNIKEVAEKVVDEMRTSAIKRGLLLTFKSRYDRNPIIHADIGKTRQVIMNIIDNAIKYTQKGTVAVLLKSDAKEKTVSIHISDTGIGLSKETIETLFDKFVRAKNANNVNVTGTGLGLFVARTMVTKMNGSLTVESEGEGKGSTFIIQFPLV